jgi:hypothetical protein
LYNIGVDVGIISVGVDVDVGVGVRVISAVYICYIARSIECKFIVCSYRILCFWFSCCVNVCVCVCVRVCAGSCLKFSICCSLLS